MNQYNQLQRLEREILRMEDWFKKAPNATPIREEIRQYYITLKNNYHAITGKKFEDRKKC